MDNALCFGLPIAIVITMVLFIVVPDTAWFIWAFGMASSGLVLPIILLIRLGSNAKR